MRRRSLGTTEDSHAQLTSMGDLAAEVDSPIRTNQGLAAHHRASLLSGEGRAIATGGKGGQLGSVVSVGGGAQLYRKRGRREPVERAKDRVQLDRQPAL